MKLRPQVGRPARPGFTVFWFCRACGYRHKWRRETDPPVRHRRKTW